ncbi:DUF3916 domain-containing protein [Candidatus Enterococcus ferrettii]|uniref:DUF3916 domain-containing protein n=1 Tax=Candidatus Enterococcus ferrettii TaxID=2815324 RepID=A0ABV0EKN5_9ENTE|nr:DUF3916 domain-containing protein [Enterococcus sp. 665A]MBO1340931.1 DUF3916 domain-containing protein [Enterococcus sp. 665A]
MDKKKQRGQRRKLEMLLKHIDDFTPFLETDCKYQHFHVPSSSFIDSQKTREKVKTEFCRAWIGTTERFILQKPDDLPFCKVVAVISVPYYWNSQIIIFYDENYYNGFWDRTGPEQFWIKLDREYSFCKDRNIKTFMRESYFQEKIIDDETFTDDLWFYEELS